VAAVALAALTARVEGASMEPTLRNGDLLLVDRLAPHLSAPERGDIVLVGLNASGLQGVKRVIGLPGDTVEIDGNHRDTPNGRAHPVVLLRPGGVGSWQQLSEPYIAGDWGVPEYCCSPDGLSLLQAPSPLTLAPGEFFVLGDNRSVSLDSRWFGLVPRTRILGRIVTRYWPFDRAGAPASSMRLIPV